MTNEFNDLLTQLTQRLDAELATAFHAGDRPSTITTEAIPTSTSFTMNDLLAAYAKLPALPTVFYVASEHVQSVGDMIYTIDNPGAPAGFDIVCRPDQIGDLRETLSGYAILRPLDDAERERRRRKWSGIDKVGR